MLIMLYSTLGENSSCAWYLFPYLEVLLIIYPSMYMCLYIIISAELGKGILFFRVFLVDNLSYLLLKETPSIETEEDTGDAWVEGTEGVPASETSAEIINCGCGSTEEEGLMLQVDYK